MRTRLATFIGTAALLCATTATPAAATAAAQPTGAIVNAGVAGATANSYIVVLEPGTSAVGSAADRLTRRYGGKVVDAYGTAVRGFSARMTERQARRLAADPAVRYVEQDAVVDLAATSTKPTWGLDRIDQRSLPLSGTYTAPSAAGVTAYVLDSGIRIGHREFAGRAAHGWDFVDNDANADDCNGHGTHVAGTIGGRTYGVAADVKLVGVRVLDCKGKGAYSAIIKGVDWVTARATRPAVANMSLGGTTSRTLNDAVHRSIAKGVTYVVAAGNDSRDACRQSPASAAAAITVGATDNTDTRGSFSNFGSCLDIFAPGVRITSASQSSNTATKTMSGTSMASPHVAGAAALVLAGHPDRTPAQVRDELVGQAGSGSVRNPGKGSPNRLLGTGFLAGSPTTGGR